MSKIVLVANPTAQSGRASALCDRDESDLRALGIEHSRPVQAARMTLTVTVLARRLRVVMPSPSPPP